jgi:hypothetical protein
MAHPVSSTPTRDASVSQGKGTPPNALTPAEWQLEQILGPKAAANTALDSFVIQERLDIDAQRVLPVGRGEKAAAEWRANQPYKLPPRVAHQLEQIAEILRRAEAC